MAAFDVQHADRAALARAASIRSARERDPAVSERAGVQTMAERLREGFRLSRFAMRLRDARR